MWGEAPEVRCPKALEDRRTRLGGWRLGELSRTGRLGDGGGRRARHRGGAARPDDVRGSGGGDRGGPRRRRGGWDDRGRGGAARSGAERLDLRKRGAVPWAHHAGDFARRVGVFGDVVFVVARNRVDAFAVDLDDHRHVLGAAEGDEIAGTDGADRQNALLEGPFAVLGHVQDGGDRGNRVGHFQSRSLQRVADEDAAPGRAVEAERRLEAIERGPYVCTFALGQPVQHRVRPREGCGCAARGGRPGGREGLRRRGRDG